MRHDIAGNPSTAIVQNVTIAHTGQPGITPKMSQQHTPMNRSPRILAIVRLLSTPTDTAHAPCDTGLHQASY